MNIFFNKRKLRNKIIIHDFWGSITSTSKSHMKENFGVFFLKVIILKLASREFNFDERLISGVILFKLGFK